VPGGIAAELDESGYRLRALWGLWIVHFHNGEHRSALDIAKRFRTFTLRSKNLRDVPVEVYSTPFAGRS
jgi:hypothetical protein